MPNRKAAPCISPTGTGHFYRNADLHGLRLALWEEAGNGSVAAYLRDAGAWVEVLASQASHAQSATLPPMMARCTFSAFWPEDDRAGIRFSGVDIMAAALNPSGLLEIDAAVLNLRQPAPLAQSLQAAGIPFVMFADDTDLCLGLYPHGSCVPRSDGPEALASAVLVHTALYRAELCCKPDMTVMEMLPRLRAMARFLVQDNALADDLVAQAMEQAIALLPHLDCERETGALLVLLIERIWCRQKLSRPN